MRTLIVLLVIAVSSSGCYSGEQRAETEESKTTKRVTCRAVESGPARHAISDNPRLAVCVGRLPRWRVDEAVVTIRRYIHAARMCQRTKGCRWSDTDLVASIEMVLDVWVWQMIDDETGELKPREGSPPAAALAGEWIVRDLEDQRR